MKSDSNTGNNNSFKNSFLVDQSKLKISNEDRVNFVQRIPFFSHWPKRKVKNLVHGTKIIPTNKGEVFQKEGSVNNNVYIIHFGQFSVSKKIETVQPAKDECDRVREFLLSPKAKRSIRSIFNNKISRVTKRPNLTQKMIHQQVEEISLLSSGQIFGEGRFLDAFNRKLKE